MADAAQQSNNGPGGAASRFEGPGWQALLFAGAVVSGIAALLQTTFNTGLAELLNDHVLHHPKSDLVAANVSFTFSTAILCVIIALSQLVVSFRGAEEEKNEPAAPRNDSATLVYFSYGAAGLLGATHIVLKVITSPILGLGLDYLFVVLGQLVTSLLIDWFGFLGVEQSSPNWARFAAIGLALGGAMMVTLSVAVFDHADIDFVIVGAAVLATIAGSLHPVQAATMQVLRARHPNPWLVALISFCGGLVWLTAISTISIAVAREDGELSGDWFAELMADISIFDALGGLCAVTFISLTIIVTPLTGMNSFYIISVFGQLLTAVLVDAAPAARWKHALPTMDASPIRIVGVVMSLLGIALLVLPESWVSKSKEDYERID